MILAGLWTLTDMRPKTTDPVVLGAHFCNCVRLDKAGNYDLLGLFNTLSSESFPFLSPSLSLFVTMTDGRGRVPFKAQIRNIETNETVWADEHIVTWREPTEDCVYVRTLVGLRFSTPGIYALELLGENGLFHSYMLRIARASTPVRA